MTTFASNKMRRNVMITDLDENDTKAATVSAAAAAAVEKHHRGHNKKRNPSKCLQTISGNFKRRSRSAECDINLVDENVGSKTEAQGNQKKTNYFNELLQTKDKQMEQLLQRLATLHKFNEEFAQENKELRNDVEALDKKVTHLRQKLNDCVNCHTLNTQLQQMTTNNKILHNDINMMKTLVYRLNVQIEYYQDKLRTDATTNNVNSSASNTHDASTSQRNDAPWQGTIHTHTLAPLLKSYDEMIRDKQELILQYKQEFETFTGQLKNAIEENTRLLQHNESLKRDFGTWREERTRLQAQIDVCRAKAEAQTRKTDLTKEKLVEVMHCYEQKMQTVVLDMEHLQAAYTRCKSELASMKSLAQLPQESIVQSLQECKELLEQLKSQHSREKSTLEQTIAELRAQVVAHNQQNSTVLEENLQLKKQSQKQTASVEELRQHAASLQRTAEKVKRSRDRLKARLRIALQWAQKLEEGQKNIQNTWDALKRLETIVKHKESQVRGLHARHMEEIEKLQNKLDQKEETIRKILKGKLSGNVG